MNSRWVFIIIFIIHLILVLVSVAISISYFSNPGSLATTLGLILIAVAVTQFFLQKLMKVLRYHPLLNLMKKMQ